MASFRKMAGRNHQKPRESFRLIKFRERIIAECGKFVEPRIAHASADDHAATDAEALQDLRERGAKFRARHSDELRAGPGWIK